MSENTDFEQMSRLDSICSMGAKISISELLNEIKNAYQYTRNWTILVIGESGIGKSWIIAQAANELNIGYIRLAGPGLVAEDIRGLAMPSKTLKTNKEYSQDIPGLVSIAEDYLRTEPTYKFQLLELLSNIFLPDTEAILFLDEYAQASKEVQDVLFQLIYDRRIDDYILPEGVMVMAASNPTNKSEYMIDKLSKAAEDRFEIYYLEPNPDEWVTWAREYKLCPDVVDWIDIHRSIYKINKGRRLHHFADKISMMSNIFGDFNKDNPSHIRRIRLWGNATIDIQSTESFIKYMKDIYEITGEQIVSGNTKAFKTLEKLVASNKIATISKINKDITNLLEKGDNIVVHDSKNENKKLGWSSIARNILEYLYILKDNHLDTVTALLMSIKNSNALKLRKAINKLFIEQKYRDSIGNAIVSTIKQND